MVAGERCRCDVVISPTVTRMCLGSISSAQGSWLDGDDAWNDSSDEPTREIHLDDHDQRAILLRCGVSSTQVRSGYGMARSMGCFERWWCFGSSLAP
jgi:hypothetical protein